MNLKLPKLLGPLLFPFAIFFWQLTYHLLFQRRDPQRAEHGDSPGESDSQSLCWRERRLERRHAPLGLSLAPLTFFFRVSVCTGQMDFFGISACRPQFAESAHVHPSLWRQHK